jgi:hypothetical protein
MVALLQLLFWLRLLLLMLLLLSPAGRLRWLPALLCCRTAKRAVQKFL